VLDKMIMAAACWSWGLVGHLGIMNIYLSPSWCTYLAPAFARARDVYTGIEVGGSNCRKSLLRPIRHSYPLRRRPSAPRAAGRRLSAEMSATQNPLVPPHPPSPWRHCGIQITLSRDYYAQSREPGSCVTWLPPLMEVDPRISKIC
jgi:hypothetical protein